jgi:hypothetical protein
MFLRDGTWSTRFVFHCEPEVILHFETMDLRMDEFGFFGTKNTAFYGELS